MKKLKEIILEASTKKLRVFDFDDTLVTTKSFIYVKHKDGKELKLTPGEYAKYIPKSGDEFDYKDFQTVKEPKEIKAISKLLKRFISSDGERSIFILTARSKYKPIQNYLKDTGYGNVYVVALNNADPKAKADWVEGKIKDGYNDILFMDDSSKNTKAVGDLKNKYPSIKMKTYTVPKALQNEAVIDQSRQSINIIVNLDKTKHADERRFRHDTNNPITDDEIIETGKRGGQKIAKLLLFDKLDIGDDVVIFDQRTALNLVCSISNPKPDTIELDIITIMQKKDFKPKPGTFKIFV